MLFTTESVRNVQPRAYPFFLIEQGSPGFALKVQPSGQRSFYYRRKAQRQRVDIALGVDLETARGRYEALAAKELQLREKQKAALAFAAGAVYFAPAPPPESRSEDGGLVNPLFYRGATFQQLKRRFLAGHVEPSLRPATATYYRFCLEKVGREMAQSKTLRGNLSVDEARAEFKAYVHAVGLSTPTLANRIREVLSSMFRWGIYEDLCCASPIFGIRVFKEKPRSRRFSQAELPAFFTALHSGSHDLNTVRCIRLILATGLRASEALGIRPVDVDLTAGTLLIPQTKNGEPFLVPLAPAVADLLREAVDGVGRERRIFRTSIFGLRQVVKHVAAKAGVTACSTHDLRRTFGTMLGELGVPVPVISRCLNHTSGGSVTTRVYALHDMLTEKREAVQKAADCLQTLGWQSAGRIHSTAANDEGAARGQVKAC